MNHKVKIGLEIGGGLIAVYVLYKLYTNYQANQQAAADASMNAMQFMPPLSAGGYAPTQTAAGPTDTGGAELNNLLQSILAPNSTSSSGTSSASGSGSNSGTSSNPAPNPFNSSPSGSAGSTVKTGIWGIQPVGPEPAPVIGATYPGSSIGTLSGVGTRVRVPTISTAPLTSDGSYTPIV